MNNNGPLFYADIKNELDNYRPHRVPVVHIYEDGERVEIISATRELKTVKKSEIQGIKWE